MHKFYLILLLLLISTVSYAQKNRGANVPTIIDKVYALIDDEKYEEAHKLLLNINESLTIEYGDSCAMMYNYEMGSCLYFLDKFEDAIPYLNKALLKKEKLYHKDCIYLELIYSIGSCYNKLKQYHNAEKYFRRVMIRGNILGFECKITTQTLRELTEIYNILGYTKLAKECATKINQKIEKMPSKSWSNRVWGLYELAESYGKHGKYDEEIETYYKILWIIESNAGKTNDDYLLYASLLRYRLLAQNRQEETIELLKEMIDIGNSNKVYNAYVCNAYEGYLEILARQNEVELVEKMLPEAIKYIKHTPKYNWPNHNLYESIGNAFADVGNYELGIKYLEKTWNKIPSNSMHSVANLGICYFFRPDYQKSISYMKKAEGMMNDSTYEITKKVIYSCLYSAYSCAQKYDEAIKYAEIVAPLILGIDGVDSYASHLISWALDLIKDNQPDRAYKLFNEVKNSLPELSDKTKILYYSQYGFASAGFSNYTDAIESLKEGIKLSIMVDGSDNKFLVPMYHNLGRAYMLQRDYDNALFYLNKSKGLQSQLNGNVMKRTIDYIKECESK